jgi:hypothetical protein
VLSQLTHDLPEDGQLVVYDSRGEKLVVLNDIGAAIYLLIDGESTPEQISAFVATTLPQKSASACRHEVDNFLKNLTDEGIIEWRVLDSSLP